MSTNIDKLQLKTNYAIKQQWTPFYTGGSVVASGDGNYLFCMCGDKVQILDVETGLVDKVLDHEDGELSCVAISTDDTIVVTATKSLLLKQWNWKEEIKCVRTWKAIHIAPVLSMSIDATSTLLATGGSDGTIKVWDLIRQYCTHNFKGSPGIVRTVCFHPTNLTLYTSADDYNIRVWDLNTSRCIAVLATHVSAVTSIQFPNEDILISGGRDNVVCMWNVITEATPTDVAPIKTIPVYESVEDIVLLSNKQISPKFCLESSADATDAQFYFITVGSKGTLRVWHSASVKSIFTNNMDVEKENSSKHAGYIHAFKLPSSDQLVCVTEDHQFDFVNLDELHLEKHLVGYNDDILDIKLLGEEESHMLVATNSPNIKIFKISSSSCHVLMGHTDTVLCVDVFSDKTSFLSSSKDNSICVWRWNSETDATMLLAKVEGHTNVVGCVAACKLSSNFFVSGSEDRTLKIWQIKSLKKGSISVHISNTALAHEKDVNSVTVSPNDKLVATASQDKLAKLWSAQSGELVGMFRGHKRGIWCVQFSPMDKILATSSADGTIKLWSLNDFTCLKTFEGHDSSVLKLMFIVRGTQIVTAGSDGLLKLWTIKSSECIQTLDHHNDKVWALCSSVDDSTLISGSADSVIAVWEDITEKLKAENIQVNETATLHHQELQNLLQEKRFEKALSLAIKLGQPFTTLNVIKEILWDENGMSNLEQHLLNLNSHEKQSLFKYIVAWNTNSRNCHEAQAVLQILFTTCTPHEIESLPDSQSIIESLLPYTERHFKRMSHIAQQATFIDYTWAVMKMTLQESK